MSCRNPKRTRESCDFHLSFTERRCAGHLLLGSERQSLGLNFTNFTKYYFLTFTLLSYIVRLSFYRYYDKSIYLGPIPFAINTM